jgi:hypothetical protein
MMISLKIRAITGNLRFVFLGFTFCALSFALVYAQPSEELIKNSRLYDGKVVAYTGEVIGDVMVRGEYAWVNMNDGTNAIGIWMPLGLASQIQSKGSYKSRGEWLEVVGVFSRSCSQHGGDLDIHAQSLRKVIPGGKFVERFNVGKRNLALALAGVLCLALISQLLKTK